MRKFFTISLGLAFIGGLAVAACGGSSETSGGTSGSGGSIAGGGGAAGAPGGAGGVSGGGAGGTGNTGNTGGTGNTGNTGGAGNTGGTIDCGTESCADLDLFGYATLPACCPDGVANKCGTDVTQLSSFLPAIPPGCLEHDQPGTIDATCPSQSQTIQGYTIDFAGCCRPDGMCGLDTSAAGSFLGVNFGCIDKTPLLDGGSPEACGGGTGGAGGGGGAGGAAGGAGGTSAGGTSAGGAGGTSAGGAGGASCAGSGEACGQGGVVCCQGLTCQGTGQNRTCG